MFGTVLKIGKEFGSERIEDEKKSPDYEGKNIYLRQLNKEVEAIRKAMSEIHKCF